MNPPNGEKKTIGTCSICRGPVVLYVNPRSGNYCECDRCGAVPTEEYFGPEIDMEPAADEAKKARSGASRRLRTAKRVDVRG